MERITPHDDLIATIIKYEFICEPIQLDRVESSILPDARVFFACPKMKASSGILILVTLLAHSLSLATRFTLAAPAFNYPVHGSRTSTSVYGSVNSTTSTTETVPTSQQPTTQQPTTQHPGRDIQHADYAVSAAEYARILRRLEEESRESIILNPENYVPDEANIEDILQIIEANEQTSTQASTESTTEATTRYFYDTTTRGFYLPNFDSTTEPTSRPWVATSIIELTGGRSFAVFVPQEYTTTTTEVIPTTSSTTELFSEPTSKTLTGGESSDTSHDNDCSICMDAIRRDEESKLRCGHRFHRNCVLTWAKKQVLYQRVEATCPICRRRMDLFDFSENHYDE